MPNRYPSIVHYFLDQALETAVEEALAHEDDEDDEDEEYIQEEEEEEEEEEGGEEEVEGGGGEEEEVEAHETREYIEVSDSPTISLNASSIVADGDGKETKRRSDEGGKGCSTSASQENEWSRGEIEGVFCSICMEVWTTGGEHHICCLPCGHVYGFSCIRKWLQQQRSAGKCPQCNRKCRLKDVRKIFASRIAAVDEESHKRILSLEAELASLEKKNADWCKKEAKWRKTEAELRSEVSKLTKRTSYVECLATEIKAKLCSQQPSVFGRNSIPEFPGLRPSCIFKSQGDLPINGARMFEIDASRQTILFVRRISGMGGTYVLTKMSLIHPHETEDIVLHPDTRAIKDLHISPDDGLALFGSLGKKLSVISMQSHNVILEYALPAAAWSCSWDLNSSHFVYAGLQNGMLLVFDMRQTVGPLKSLHGLTSNPIHSIHPLLHDSTLSPSPCVLSASSIGLCQWDIHIAGSNERPILVPETTNPGVCISSSYSPNSNDIVASYRPRVELSDDTASSQPLSSASSGINGYSVEGSHVHFKKMGGDTYQRLASASTTVNNIRLPKTSIIELENQRHLFAAWEESSLDILLQELPSFAVSQRFRCASYPIYDVKQARVLDQRLLGLLSEDRLQLFGL